MFPVAQCTVVQQQQQSSSVVDTFTKSPLCETLDVEIQTTVVCRHIDEMKAAFQRTVLYLRSGTRLYDGVIIAVIDAGKYVGHAFALLRFDSVVYFVEVENWEHDGLNIMRLPCSASRLVDNGKRWMADLIEMWPVGRNRIYFTFEIGERLENIATIPKRPVSRAMQAYLAATRRLSTNLVIRSKLL
jgi:hypothetical protein